MKEYNLPKVLCDSACNNYGNDGFFKLNVVLESTSTKNKLNSRKILGKDEMKDDSANPIQIIINGSFSGLLKFSGNWQLLEYVQHPVCFEC